MELSDDDVMLLRVRHRPTNDSDDDARAASRDTGSTVICDGRCRCPGPCRKRHIALPRAGNAIGRGSSGGAPYEYYICMYTFVLFGVWGNFAFPQIRMPRPMRAHPLASLCSSLALSALLCAVNLNMPVNNLGTWTTLDDRMTE